MGNLKHTVLDVITCLSTAAQEGDRITSYWQGEIYNEENNAAIAISKSKNENKS